MTEIRQMLASKGSACRSGYSLTPQYITIHNTANTNKGAGAASHGAHLRSGGAGKSVSWHYAVDDQLIVQSIPDNEVAWHAGDGGNGSGNRKSIAIEICENPESSLMAATDNAAALTAMLMKKYNIPIANVVQHNRWSGKDCPRRIRAGTPYDWNTFIKKVQTFLNGAGSAPSASKPASAPKMIATTDTEYVVLSNGTNCEYFASASVDAIAGSLKPGNYPVTKVMAEGAVSAWNWVVILVNGKEYWAVLLPDRSDLSKKDPGGKWYRVQVGAFKDPKAAEALKAELAAMGIGAVVKEG